MVRRRMASPKPSAPSRSFARPQTTTRSSYASPPPRPTQPVPTASAGYATPPPGGMGMGATASRGPSLMGQMAATAGGVAIGSAVGHAVGNMMTGGSGGRSEDASAAPSGAQTTGPPAVPLSAADGQPMSIPCEFEWKQFVECTQTQSDVSLCQSLNEAFKQCRARFS